MGIKNELFWQEVELKNIIVLIGIIGAFYGFPSATVVGAQVAPKADLAREIDNYYQKMLSADFMERYEALVFFSQIKKEDLSERIIGAAINVFRAETERLKEFREMVKKPGRIEEKVPRDMLYLNSEEYATYHGSLCEIVGISGDKSLLPLLAEYCLESKVLLNFGDYAAGVVMEMVLKPDINRLKKMKSISVLGDMLKPKKGGYIASGEMRYKLKKVLIQTASDNDKSIRQVSVRALGDSMDKDVIPILEKISRSDPFHFEDKLVPSVEGRVPERRIEKYPVRDEAQKALKKLNEK